MLLLLSGILAGFGIALMSAINDRLRRHLEVPFLTAFVSFSVGLVVIVLIAAFSGDLFSFRTDAFNIAPLWVWTGGLLGMMSLSAAVLVFPKLGAVQAAVTPILGQVVMGVLIDTFGWMNAKPIALSPGRMLGVALVLAGVLVAVVLPNLKALKKDKGGAGLWLWRGVGVFGGMCAATQTAVNGELGQLLSSPLNAATVSFLGGVLGLAAAVSVFEKSWGKLAAPMHDKPVWIWLGGGLSAGFIYAGIWLAPQIGTGSVVVLMLTGSVTGSLLVDKFGLFGAPRKGIKAAQIAGVAVLLAGVACIRLV